MAWRRSGDKLLSEPMMVSLLTHICVDRPQWVKPMAAIPMVTGFDNGPFRTTYNHVLQRAFMENHNSVFKDIRQCFRGIFQCRCQGHRAVRYNCCGRIVIPTGIASWLADGRRVSSWKEATVTFSSCKEETLIFVLRVGNLSFPCELCLMWKTGDRPTRVRWWHQTITWPKCWPSLSPSHGELIMSLDFSVSFDIGIESCFNLILDCNEIIECLHVRRKK